MPILNVQGIPGTIMPTKLNDILKGLQSAVAGVEELGLINEQVTVFFPPDLLQDGLGEEIIIEIKGLFGKTEHTNEVRNKLCAKVGQVAKTFFPEAFVEVIIDVPYNAEWGYWKS